MDASFVPPEKIRNETQMKSQRHSRKSRSYSGRQPPIGQNVIPPHFRGNKDAPETVCMGKLASSSTNGPPVERL